MKAAKSIRNNSAKLFEIESYLSEHVLSLTDIQNLKFNLKNVDLILPIQLIKYFDNAARIQVLIKIKNILLNFFTGILRIRSFNTIAAKYICR